MSEWLICTAMGFSTVLGAMQLVGVDVQRMARFAIGLPRYVRDYRRYQRMLSRGAAGWRARLGDVRPMLEDRWAEAASITPHYFLQDLWAARLIHSRRPKRHVDLGSRLDGFVAHLLTFMDVEVLDVRPLSIQVPGLKFVQTDGTDLGGVADDSLESLSSLHAVEHFGLGRYGDAVDPEACFRAMRALARVLAPGGRLYFSVPMGRERVHFNAHRVFSPDTILSVFQGQGMTLVSFGAIDDSGRLLDGAKPTDLASARLGCGLFEWTK